MKYFRIGAVRNEWHSWDVHSDEIVQTHTKIKPFVKVGPVKKGISGKAKDPRPRSERIQIRLAGTTERAVAKGIKASGHQFVVKNRDGHPRGAFATLEEAEASAGDSDAIFDRLEGRNVRRRRDRYEIPDPGVEELPEQWTVGA
jgi:hypothetical protein